MHEKTSSTKTVLLSEEIAQRLSEEVTHTPKMETMTLNEQVEVALGEWLAMKESGRAQHAKLLSGSSPSSGSSKRVAERKKPTLVRGAP